MAGDKAFDTKGYRKQFTQLKNRFKDLYDQRMPALENYEQFVNTQLDTLIGETAPAARDMFRQAKQMGDTYANEFLPATSDYLKSATGYDTADRRAGEKSKAMVDVQTGADAAREQSLQRLESYGIDPSQTRNASLDQNIRLQTALDQVRAGKEAELDVEERGRAYTRDALDMGGELQRGATSMTGVASDLLSNNTELAGRNAETWANIYGTPAENIRDRAALTRDSLSASQWEKMAKQNAKAAEGGGGMDWAGLGQTVGMVGGAALGSFGGPAGMMMGASAGGALGRAAGGGASGQGFDSSSFSPNAGAGFSNSWGGGGGGDPTAASNVDWSGWSGGANVAPGSGATGLSYR